MSDEKTPIFSGADAAATDSGAEAKTEAKAETKTTIKAPEIEEAPKPSELDLLKERATTMGITFSGNIGVAGLKKKIAEKMEGPAEEEEAADDSQTSVDRPMSKREREQAIRDDLYARKMKLRRVQIFNVNPAKQDLEGELLDAEF